MQSNKEHGASLPDERKQTDKSLEAERSKTDTSLLAGRKRRERETDEAVLSNRIEADQVRNQTRLDSDSSTGPNSPDSDELLLQERQSADETLDTERRRVDAILEAERMQKENDERGLFRTERKETDKNLTNERSKTDVEVSRGKAELTTRDEFLAIVSHDLRNPLGSITMAADYLCEKLSYTTADEDTKELLDIIKRNAGQANRLISDLMDMERIAAGKLSLQVKTHITSEIIQDSINSFQAHALKKKLLLSANSEIYAVPVVKCDRDRISQVFSNLIGNAIKFTPNGGSITLSARVFDSRVEISIADSGPGIPEDMLQKVFGRFLQIGKNDRNGLGLGLYISKMIVEAHFGRMWVESKLGQGSTFYFTLPL